MVDFVLTVDKKKNGIAQLVLLMQEENVGNGTRVLLNAWRVNHAGQPDESGWPSQMVLRVAERRGVLCNAKWADAPRLFDGSAREFIVYLFDRNYNIGNLRLSDDHEGKRLALAFAVAGRANTLARRNMLADGLTNLEVDAVDFWFKLVTSGNRKRAAMAGLSAFLLGADDKRRTSNG